MAQCRVNQHGGDPDPLDTTGLCLLSLDGGGVRGLSTLYILKNIMDRLNSRRKDENLQQVKPCEVFDLIGGTSTGGLIAIMLGRLEMSVDECIVAYSNLTEMVFGQKLSRTPFDLTGRVKAQFDSAQLGAAIDNVVAQCGASGTDLFDDGISRGCRTFVCSIDHHTKDMVRLRSYDLPHEPQIRATICQAALATSAATTFFEPVNIGDRRFADGGFGANNPVDEVEGEASNIWCQETGDLKPLVKCFISIGTGDPGKKAFEDSILKFLTKTVVGIATETEQTDRKFNARWAKHYDDKRYFRFNVEQGLQDVGLEEYKKKGTIEAASCGYLSHTAQVFRVRDCIQNLSLKQSRTATDFSDVITGFKERCKMVERHSVAFSLKGIPLIDHFVQRDQDMQKLEDFFFDQTPQPVRRKVFVVHGLGGIGKTQLCVGFARKHQAQFTSVLWMDGSSEDALKQSFASVFRMLPANEVLPDLVEAAERQTASAELIVQGVLDWLSISSNQGWLHIIDNMDHDINTNNKDPSAYDWKKYCAQVDHGSLLITSRLSTLTVPQYALHLKEMTPDEARELFGVHSGKLVSAFTESESNDLETLLRKLEGMPLALAQAGAFIGQTNTSLGEYLDYYNSTWDDLIVEQDSYPLQGYAQRSMLTTWRISYQQVESQNREAATLLKLWAFLDPKDLWYELITCAVQLEPQIPIPEWLSILAKDRLRFRGAFRLLRRYSLVNNGDNDNYSMHAVLHSWCRHLVSISSTDEPFPELAVNIVTQMLPGENDKDSLALWKRLLPHGQQLLYYLRLGTPWRLSHVPMLAYQEVARLLTYNRAYEEAADVLERTLLEEEKICGPDHPFTVAIALTLSQVYNRLHKYTKSQPLAERALAVYQRLLPISHASVAGPMASTLINLGETHHGQGRPQAAEDMYKLAIALCEQRQHTQLHGLALESLGHLYTEQARLTEAQVVFQRALELSSKVYGPDHHSTLRATSGLSEVYYKLGKVVQANALVERAAAGFDIMMLEDCYLGFEVAIERIQLFEKQGKYTEAEELAKRILAENEGRFGPEHLNTLFATFTLAGLYNQDNRSQEARTLYEQLIPRLESALGPRDEMLFNVMESLACMYANLHMFSEAEELFKRTLIEREKVLGSGHRATLTSISNLGCFYRQTGDKVQEIESYERLLLACKKHLGIEHKRTLEAAGTLHQALGLTLGNFSRSSSNITLDSDYNLVALCRCVDSSWLRSSISLNDLLENEGGRFVWIQNKKGNFVATARNIRLEHAGTFLAAELADRNSVWNETTIHLEERISNHDGKLNFVTADQESSSARSLLSQ